MALMKLILGPSHGLLEKQGELKICPWEHQGEEEGREGEGGKEKRKGGKERRKEKKKGEEERKKKEEEEGVLLCAVSRPERKKTWNCATRGRFPPTLVNLCLGAV